MTSRIAIVLFACFQLYVLNELSHRVAALNDAGVECGPVEYFEPETPLNPLTPDPLPTTEDM